MARMRSLKPEFWADEELACQLTRDERMLYLGLWNLADEHSRLRGDPRYIKGQLFPYDDDITPDGIEKMLGNLGALGKVHAYRVGAGRFLFLPNLGKHQRLETDKVPSRLPAPDQAERTPDDRANESESGANKSARDPDESERGADKDALKHVAGGMEHVAGGMDAHAGARAAPPPRGTLIANQLLAEHVAACAAKPPRPVQGKVGEAIDALLDDPEIQPDEIREGLRRLRAKPNLGPGVLPSLVNEYRQELADPSLAQRASPKRGHQPYRNPPDESAYEGTL
jgi:hypothetical protein